MKAVPRGFQEVWTSRLRRALGVTPTRPPLGLAAQQEAELDRPHTSPPAASQLTFPIRSGQ